MGNLMAPSSGHSPLGTRLRKALAWVLLPGLALGVMLGCGAATSTGAPTVTTFTPGYGNTVQGTEVTIYGTGFSQSLQQVYFGGVAVASAPAADQGVNGVSDTQIVVYVPTAAVTGDITVTTSGGSASSPSEFVVVPALTAAASPASGSTSGQTAVTLTGQGLLGVSQISVTLAGSGVVDVSPEPGATANTLTFKLPTGAQVSSTNQMELLNDYQNQGVPPVAFQYDVTD